MAQGEGRRWFLLVEDNEDEERLATRAFKRAGVEGAEIVVARDGEEAIRILGDSVQEPPKFALLDIKLPKISGLDVLKWMRERSELQTVPAVVLIGSVGAIDLGSIYALGANSLVRKELDYETYMDRMVPTLRYWLDVNATPNLNGRL